MAITYHAGRRVQGARGAEELASTGWTMVSGMTLTSGTGIVVDTSSNHQSSYDLGASGALTPNDSWVCDWDITRNSGDNNNHPSLMFKSANTNYHDTTVNGENQVLLHYPANGNTGNSSGILATHVQFHISNSQYEVGIDSTYCQDVGTTLYYRMYMSKGGAAGDGIRFIRRSAWTSDALRTAEGSTGKEVDSVSTSAVNSGWSSTDALRYVIVINKNSNQANWTLSNFKFWNGVESSGVADNMLSHTPTINLNFTDGYAGDTKPTNVQTGSRWEETDTRKMYHYEAGDPTYETDFSTNTGWTTTNSSNLNIASGELQIVSTAGLASIYYDLTSITGDFLIRYTTSFTTMGSQSLGIHWSGVSDSIATAQTAQDALSFIVYDGSGDFQSSTTSGVRPDQTPNQGILTNSPNPTTGTNYYVELKRDGSNWITSLYNNADYDSTIATRTVSITAGITGLRYFKVMTYTTGADVGKIDDLKFYNGVTTPVMPNAWSEEGT